MRNELLEGALSTIPMILKRMTMPYRMLLSSRIDIGVVFLGRMSLITGKFLTSGVLNVVCGLACSILNNQNLYSHPITERVYEPV